MVEYSEQQLDTVFQALADSTRRRMLVQLRSGQQTVSNLAQPYNMSLAAASKHIKKLESAGLVEREIVGRVHHCRLAPVALKYASKWLSAYERFWNTGLDRLEAVLNEEQISLQNNEVKETKGRANDINE